jgi:hypothetical protein
MFATFIPHTEKRSPNLKKKMKAKSLLLAAAIATVTAVSSSAQNTVFSVNAVGFVNKTVTTGFNLISNPLIAEDNTYAGLFGNTLPHGTQIFKFDANTGFESAQYFVFPALSFWSPASAATRTLVPGQGFFINIPSGTTSHTITFVGNVPQGSLTTPLEQGFQLIASQVPQAGELVADLGMPIGHQDQVFRFMGGGFVSSTYFDFGTSQFWSPSIPPSLDVAEAVFLNRQNGAPGSWTRLFDVNSQ